MMSLLSACSIEKHLLHSASFPNHLNLLFIFAKLTGCNPENSPTTRCVKYVYVTISLLLVIVSGQRGIMSMDRSIVNRLLSV